MLFSIRKKCLEVKQLYKGSEKKFECQLIYLKNRFGILKFLLDKNYKVGNLILPKNSISLGYFWENRPYNIYQWFYRGKLLASYFNISDKTRLSRDTFFWRDLILDILVTPTNKVEVLDRDELKIVTDLHLLKYIKETEDLILKDFEKIINKLNIMVEDYQLN